MRYERFGHDGAETILIEERVGTGRAIERDFSPLSLSDYFVLSLWVRPGAQQRGAITTGSRAPRREGRVRAEKRKIESGGGIIGRTPFQAQSLLVSVLSAVSSFMHIVFVHPNFPAQFGHVGKHFSDRLGWRCTFVSERPPAKSGRIERLQYRPRGGATRANHYCTRTFENATRHAMAVYEALKARPDIRPDLVVGHSGFGTTLFLKELYPGVPVVNYFEYFYRTRNSDMDFRPDFPSTELNRLRARARNGMILLDLDNCDAGYSPTAWQRDRLPAEYHGKVAVIHDGIDTAIWKPDPAPLRQVGGFDIPEGVKVVTYATRGMESMRGFDIFMRAAARLAKKRSDVLFLVAGQDRVHYGGDSRFTGGKSFKQWTLDQVGLDPSRVKFLGLLEPRELARLFQRTDCHVYLTVPFVLSWSLLDALACGAPVVASDTAPVREVIEHGRTGLLTDFFDADELARTVEKVIDDPTGHRALGRAGAELVSERYAMEVCLPSLRKLFESMVGLQGRGPRNMRPEIGSTESDSSSPARSPRENDPIPWM